MVQALIVHRRDNVATAVARLEAGTEIGATAPDGSTVAIRTLEPIAYGHKLALADIPAGAEIVKYGEIIGLATAAIAKGAHVHVHNVRTRRGRTDPAREGK